MGAEISTLRAIQDLARPVFTTREIAALRGASLSATSKTLGRLEREGIIVRAARGIWSVPSNPRFTPFALIHYLTGNHSAYVSLLTALNLRGLIEQIPQVHYAATTGHTRLLRTPLGAFSFHKIDAGLFDGFEWDEGSRTYLIATPEKAVFDCFYLSSRKGGRFRYLPEMQLEEGFDFDRLKSWASQVSYQRIRNHVLHRVDRLREEHGIHRPG